MRVLLLTENDVRQVLTLEMALSAVEDACADLALEQAQNMPAAGPRPTWRCCISWPQRTRALASWATKRMPAARAVRSFTSRCSTVPTVALVALIQAEHLGRCAPGAASGVATEYMARPDAAEVGLFGSGKQARTQLQAVCQVRKITRVQVYSPHEQKSPPLCRRHERTVPGRCQARATAGTGGRRQRHCHYGDEQPRAGVQRPLARRGDHINAIGSNFLARADFDAVTVRRCDVIIADSKEQARIEAGDFVQALEDGSIHWADIHELGQVIVGRYTGRARAQDVTLFKSLGLALEDVAVAAAVYGKAKSMGLGRMLEW